MGNWGDLGVNWSSADTLRGSNTVFKELSECWGERRFAEKTADWARIAEWFGSGFNYNDFVAGFDTDMDGYLNYIDHLLQVTDNYWNYNPGVGEVQWTWYTPYWFPISWTDARYLEVTGDPAIINLPVSYPTGNTGVVMEYLFQRRKMLNLCKWAYEWNTGSEHSSDWSQIRFKHPKSITPAGWLSNGASIGKIPAHTWEVWDQRSRDLTGYHGMKTRKIYSEVITEDIKSTDADYHYSPWLDVSTIKAPETYTDEWYCIFSMWTFVFKCEAGFQYHD
jgi:hypothetical protein